MKEAGVKAWLPSLLRLVLVVLLVAFVTNPGWFEPLLKPLTENNAPAVYNQGSLLALTLLHLRTVLSATVAATIVAVALAILVTRPAGVEFLPLS
ncbi:MAG: ABC transporter permease, partial [Mesorhizobium sp.]